MSIFPHAAALALQPLVAGVSRALGLGQGPDAFDDLSRFLTDRLLDHSRRLPEALRRAHDRAWRALEVALAGPSFAGALGRAEDAALRRQIEAFLRHAELGPQPDSRDDFRR